MFHTKAFQSFFENLEYNTITIFFGWDTKKILKEMNPEVGIIKKEKSNVKAMLGSACLVLLKPLLLVFLIALAPSGGHF